MLRPTGQTEVDVRISRKGITEPCYEGILEPESISALPRVYAGRSLLPAKFSDIKVPVLNANDSSRLLERGTELGVVEPIDLFDNRSVQGEQGNFSPSPQHEMLTEQGQEVIEKMIANLPSELDVEQRAKVRALLVRHRGILSTGDHDIGRTNLVEHRIDTGDARPIRQPLRRQTFEHTKFIREETDEMLRHGIIEPAASPWASNVVLVKKKDGTLRFCVDYRRLNAVTYKDSYPLPLIDNCLNALSGSSWYSTLDLRSGYYNIPIAEEDRDKSAFITQGGCFRFTVMPFGLTCAPSVFQRLMDIVLCGLSYMTCLVYLDDVIVFGRSFDEQLERLEQVFDRLAHANLKLKPSKCSLCQRSVDFLGHVVSADGIAMQDAKISAIIDWPPCKNVGEVRAFMGLTGYYRRFVQNFSVIASPLYSLMKKNVEFEWMTECQEAMNELKSRLVSKPILALPMSEGRYILDTDASDYGLGAVLSQEQDGIEQVIAYASRTLNKTERKYEMTRKELLAIVYGLKQYKQYLLGRHFVIRTDHAALTWLRRTAEPMPQLVRWLTFIEQYDYEVVHRSGTQHGNADGLSRRPPEEHETMHNEPARVAVIHYGASSQHFDSVDAAKFLYKRLPTVEDIGMGDAKVYSENLPIQPESPSFHVVKVITQKGGYFRLGRGGSRY